MANRILFISSIIAFVCVGILGAKPTHARRYPVEVQSNPAGARVIVEGLLSTPNVTTPVTIKIPTGVRTIRLEKEGFKTEVRKVEVLARTSVYVDLEAKVAPAQITLKPRDPSQATGTKFFINGKPYTELPAKIPLQPGRYLIEVKKEGFAVWRRWLDVGAGEQRTVDVQLEVEPDTNVEVTPTAPVVVKNDGTTARLIVNANVEDAAVFVNGDAVGQTPWASGALRAGVYQVKVAAPGFTSWLRIVGLEQGTTETIDVVLVPAAKPIDGENGDKTDVTEEAMRRALYASKDVRPQLSVTSYAAHGVPFGQVTIDLSVGYPYIGEGRITTGIFTRQHMALDASLELRTYGQVTEFGVASKLRVLYRQPWAVAMMLNLGGGGGPDSRDTFYANFGAVGSVAIADRFLISLRTYLNVYTDRHCATTPQAGEPAVCNAPPPGITTQEVRDRFSGVRFMLSLIFEAALTEQIGLFGILEGAPFQDQRMAYTEDFADFMLGADPRIYGRVGVSFKF